MHQCTEPAETLGGGDRLSPLHFWGDFFPVLRIDANAQWPCDCDDGDEKGADT